MPTLVTRFLAIIACLFTGLPAMAQLQPGDTRIELPEAQFPEESTALPLALPPVEREVAPPQGIEVRVDRYEIVGSTVFSDAELAAVVAPYRGRSIRSDELIAAQAAVTRHYVDAGYATSRATIPDQSMSRGTVRIEVVEGTLAAVDVQGNEWFDASYFEGRLLLVGQAPLDIFGLEERLQVFQQDGRIERVEAELQPPNERGESVLRLVVTESPPWRARFEGSNGFSPSVGSAGGSVELWFANALGRGDVFRGEMQLTEGLEDFDLGYAVPLNAYDTTVELQFRTSKADIVEPRFDALNISALAQTFGLEVSQPLVRTRNDRFWVRLGFEHRSVRAKLLGTEFAFPPARDRTPRVSVLRASADWVHKTRRDVVALRSQLSFGIDAFGATRESRASVPDSRYVAWLGQAQWAHVLPPSWLESQIVTRADVQVANDPLLPIEQFSIGGRDSVRGYRENELVRDNGAVVSAELRVPLWREALGRHVLQAVPFMDYGRVWNNGPEPGDKLLWSVGMGVRILPTRWLRAEVYWGLRLDHIRNDHRVPQDYGVHMRLVVDVPSY